MSVLQYSIPGPTGAKLYHNLVGDSGTTAQRPSNPRDKQTYYDTTLGEVIWYSLSGTEWVDAAGATA